jgi:hypothetical protein
VTDEAGDPTPEVADQPANRGRPAWLFPMAFVTVVIVLGAIALLRGPGTADPATPEGALQLYLQGIAQSDWDQSFAFLDPLDFTDCRPEHIANAANPDFSGAIHRESRRTDGRATLFVDLRFGQGGPFDTWTNRESFEMVERDGFWYVTGDPWPYFRWSCTTR